MTRVRPPPVSTRRNTAAPPASGAPGSPSISSVASKSVDEGKLGRGDRGVVDNSQRDTLKKGPDTPVVETNREVGSDSAGKGVSVGKLTADSYKAFGARSSSSSDSESDSETVYCPGGPGKKSCGDPVRDPGVQCDICDTWFHPFCQSVSVEAYKALKVHDVLSWICSACKILLDDKSKEVLKPFRESVGLASKMDKMGMALNEHLSKMERDLQVQGEILEKHSKLLEESVKEISLHKASYSEVVQSNCENVLKKVSAKIDKLPSVAPPAVNTAPASAVDRSTSHELAGIFDNFMDKEKRKLNVVVHNLRESDKAEWDASMVRHIIREELKLVVRTTKTFRVGKRSDDKPRLLIVTFESLDMKTEVLKQSRLLKDSTEWSNIYITQDLTWSQREDLRKLKAELAQRKGSGEEDLVIRNFKIVKLDKSRPAKGGTAQRSGGAARPPPTGDQPAASGTDHGVSLKDSAAAQSRVYTRTPAEVPSCSGVSSSGGGTQGGRSGDDPSSH